MTLLKFGNTILNVDELVSATIDEEAQQLTLQMTQGQFTLALDDSTRAAYHWLAERCAAVFDATSTVGDAPPGGLSKNAWMLLLRIERYETRTELLGLPIDEDDTDIAIELERKMYIRTDVHHAWLTERGRALLEEHRSEESEESEEEER